MLPPKNKPEHIAARVDLLDGYGYIGTIDSLAGGDILKWGQVMSVSFEKTITKLMLNRDVSDYNERLQEVYRKKHERENK